MCLVWILISGINVNVEIPLLRERTTERKRGRRETSIDSNLTKRRELKKRKMRMERKERCV